MILIITNTEDLTADFVVRELTRRGIQFARLNTDEFPINGLGVAWFGRNQDPSAQIRWSNRERALDLNAVEAVWYRRPITPVVDAEISDSGVRKFAENESYEFLRGLWYSLDCFWMSHPDAIRRAEHKIVQLHEATRCGFQIPNTVVTNSPDDVSRLHEDSATGIVIKPLYLGYLEEDGVGKFIYTTRLSTTHLADERAIRFAPSIYQECIDKVADVRVTVVGRRVFAAKIVTDSLPEHIPDWRYAEIDSLQHEVHELPRSLVRSCIELVQRLGLEFGAIDLVLNQDNEYVFLEINPNGQWAWLESAVGANISSAIVDRLLASGG